MGVALRLARSAHSLLRVALRLARKVAYRAALVLCGASAVPVCYWHRSASAAPVLCDAHAFALHNA